MNNKHTEYFTSLLKNRVGWDISSYDSFVFSTKLSVAMRRNSVNHIDDLIEKMEASPNLFMWKIIEDITTLSTSFYQDYKVFKGIENIVFPYLLNKRENDKKLKILSIGCSTGQELYSIAISIKKIISNYKEWDIKLKGIDISSSAIHYAQLGNYNNFEVQHGLNVKDIIENFTKIGNSWQAKSDLVNMVKFERCNALDISSERGYDLILCRNMLRVFDDEIRENIIEKIFNKLDVDGFFCLGLGEEYPIINKFYEPSDIECVYRVKDRISSSKASAAYDKMPSFKRPENFTMMGKKKGE